MARTKRSAKHYLSQVEERQLGVSLSRLEAVRNKRRNKYSVTDPLAKELSHLIKKVQDLLDDYTHRR